MGFARIVYECSTLTRVIPPVGLSCISPSMLFDAIMLPLLHKVGVLFELDPKNGVEGKYIKFVPAEIEASRGKVRQIVGEVILATEKTTRTR
jgi:hypothetical protein